MTAQGERIIDWVDSVCGNPLADLGALERVVFVMKNGQTYTRHR